MYLLTIKLDHTNIHHILIQANTKEDVHHLAVHYLEPEEYTVEFLGNPTDLAGAQSEIQHVKSNLMSGGRHGSCYDNDDRDWPGTNLKP